MTMIFGRGVAMAAPIMGMEQRRAATAMTKIRVGDILCQ
jgi:hypothetical protein